MPDLPETEEYTAGITQLEVGTPVRGGPNGESNLPLKQLANRTAFLKALADANAAGLSQELLDRAAGDQVLAADIQRLIDIGEWDMTAVVAGATLVAADNEGLASAPDGAGGYNLDITGPLLQTGTSHFGAANSTRVQQSGPGSMALVWPDIAIGDNLEGFIVAIRPDTWTLAKTLDAMNGNAVAGDYVAMTQIAADGSVQALAYVDGVFVSLGATSLVLVAGDSLRVATNFDTGAYSIQQNVAAAVALGTQSFAGWPANLEVALIPVFSAASPVILGAGAVNQLISMTFAPATDPLLSVSDPALPAGAQDGDRYRITAPGSFAGKTTIVGDVAEVTSAGTDIIVTRAGLTEAAVAALVQNDLSALEAQDRLLTAWQTVQINAQLLGVFNAPSELPNPEPAIGTAVLAGSTLSGGWELIPNIAEGWIIFWDGVEWRGAIAQPGSRWAMTGPAFSGINGSSDFIYAQARADFSNEYNTPWPYLLLIPAPPLGWDWVSGAGRAGPTTVFHTSTSLSVDLNRLMQDSTIVVQDNLVLAFTGANTGVAKPNAYGQIRLHCGAPLPGIYKITLATDISGAVDKRIIGDGLDAMGNIFLRNGEMATINWSVSGSEPRISVAGIARAVRGLNASADDQYGSVVVTAAANVTVRGNDIRSIEIKGDNAAAAVNIELDFVPAHSGPIDVKFDSAIASLTWSSPDGALVTALPASVTAGTLRIRNAASGSNVAGAWEEW